MNWEGDQVQTLEEFLSEWNRTTKDRSFIPISRDSSQQAAIRFIDAITQIVEDRESVDTVAVVAHGGITVDTLRTIAGDAQMRDRRPELVTNGVPCGAVTVLERDDDTWHLVQLPSVDHLGATVEHRPA